MRIAVTTLSKSLLLFRRLFSDKIRPVEPVEPERTSSRSLLSLPGRSRRDVPIRCVSMMRHARIYPPSRIRIDASPILPPHAAPVPKDRKLHCVVNEYAVRRDTKTISSSSAFWKARPWLSETTDRRRSHRIPRLRSEYSPSTAKAVFPYLTDEQAENLS